MEKNVCATENVCFFSTLLDVIKIPEKNLIVSKFWALTLQIKPNFPVK
jgi:hypothetical protein